MPPGETFPYDLSNHAKTRIVERKIDLQWIVLTMKAPALRESHPNDDDCQCVYRRIPAAEGRVLKVVYNAATKPWRIVTVHFDRRMRDRL